MRFSTDTEWTFDQRAGDPETPNPWLPLKLEHSGLLGVFRAAELDDGLYIIGTISGLRRAALGDRHQLSPMICSVQTRPAGRGVDEVVAAHLLAVSLTRRPAWGPHTPLSSPRPDMPPRSPQASASARGYGR